jgi:hypothetical protein
MEPPQREKRRKKKKRRKKEKEGRGTLDGPVMPNGLA